MAPLLAEEALPVNVGRYTLLAEIGRGGAAVVYFGRLTGPAGIHREVAIKRMLPHLARDPQFVTSFLDEARLVSTLRHANVLSAVDVTEENGELLIVMDYVAGESLARLLRLMHDAKKRAPLPVAIGIVTGVLRGLHAAHESTFGDGRSLRVVHRDVSPQNVLVGTDGVPRVIDFGVATSVVQHHLTEQGTIKGKLAYMAPEVIREGTASTKSDIFSAGVVLWETLTTRRLFAGKNDGQAMLNVLEAPIARPSEHNPEVTEALDLITLRALERTPDRRFATALDMAKALEAVVPPATATTIGEWVQHTAAESLAERERRLETARRLEPPSEPALPAAVAAAATGIAGVEDTVVLPTTTRSPARTPKVRRLVLILAACSAAASFAFVRGTCGGDERAPTAAPTTSPAPAAQTVTPETSSTAEARPTTPPSAKTSPRSKAKRRRPARRRSAASKKPSSQDPRNHELWTKD